jgi:predicted DNA-binding protein
MGDGLIIEKRPLKGEDGYKVFSIRIKDETVERLDEISQQTNRSRNELIKMFIEYGLNNCEIK